MKMFVLCFVWTCFEILVNVGCFYILFAGKILIYHGGHNKLWGGGWAERLGRGKSRVVKGGTYKEEPYFSEGGICQNAG